MTICSSLTGMAGPSITADSTKKARIRGGLCAPVLGPLMQNRWIIVLLAALTVVQVALTAAGTIAWQCPLKSTLGVAGPGCGLTRAMVLFAQGHWKAAIDLHAFAPIFLGLGMLLVIGSILPAAHQQKMAHRIAAFERRTAIVALLTLSIMAYWILRITNLI